MSATGTTSDQQVGALYGDHYGWLHTWLRRKLGCSFQAEDLAQDTFLRLIVRPRDIHEKHDPRAYLTTIAQGLVIDHWRRQEIERTWIAAIASLPESLAPSPEEQAIIVETLIEVDRVLEKLPPKPREAFLLVHLHDLSYAEIATKLEVSERMVKKYMAQAMLHCLTTGASFQRALA